ncbi:MAG: hypothetical protein MK180_02175 [Rhodobacteraceae bacterium]|nr:hypothetical protein [Paracoccaceae bacterium]
MNYPFKPLDNVTDFHPALITLRARLRDAYLACSAMASELDGASAVAAEALAEMHGHHGILLDHAAGPSGVPAERVHPHPPRFKSGTGAAVLEDGILPGVLAVREDRVLTALNRAMSLNHSAAMHRLLIEMKADLIALHDEIDLQ